MTDDLTPIDDLPLLDRSRLETWATCPLRGRLVDTVVKSVDSIAETGNQVHHAMSEMIRFYIESFERYPSRTELVEYLHDRCRESRPDVQPDVLAAMKASRWSIVEYILNIAPKNVLLFDGGEGKRSGQLAVDLESVPVRVTSEVDLVHATESKDVITEIDWKSGHKHWTDADVKSAFQFQMHAFLLFDRFPDVQCVRTRIWNTRSNHLTYTVEFTRDRLADYAARVTTAASEWYRWNVLRPDKTPDAWPARDKCDTCPAVGICTAADVDLTMTPETQLRGLCLLTERTKTITKRLAAIVKETGRDVVSDGIAFGHFGKTPSKPKDGIYSVGASDDD